MGLPWSSFVLLVVPPVAVFVLALAHWLGARRGGEDAEKKKAGE